MGLVVLPVALFLGLAWIGVTLGVALVSWLILRRAAGRVAAAVSVAAILVASCVVPNASGLADQRKFDTMKADCGWQVLQRAQNIEGVFIRSDSPEKERYVSDTLAERLLRGYQVVQFTKGSGLEQVVRGAGNAADRSALPARSLPYAVDFSTTMVGHYRREQMLIVNEKREVMARSVEYWPADPPNDRSAVDYAMNLITIQPGRQYCQSLYDPAAMVQEVLKPKGKT